MMLQVLLIWAGLVLAFLCLVVKVGRGRKVKQDEARAVRAEAERQAAYESRCQTITDYMEAVDQRKHRKHKAS
jgi:hypothetical protein